MGINSSSSFISEAGTQMLITSIELQIFRSSCWQWQWQIRLWQITNWSQDPWLSSASTWDSVAAYLGSRPCCDLAPTTHLQLRARGSSPLISLTHSVASFEMEARNLGASFIWVASLSYRYLPLISLTLSKSKSIDVPTTITHGYHISQHQLVIFRKVPFTRIRSP